MPTVKTRVYHSERRDTQAQETRKRILAAARELFVRRGYVPTSIAAIARKAKVATPTVYAAFGSKRAILTEIADRLSEDTRRAAGAEGDLTRLDAHEQVRVLARFQRLHGDIGGDVLQMVQGTALTDPDAAEVVAQREGARRERARVFIRSWKAQGALRPRLTDDDAIDILSALTGPELYRLFVKGAGWSGDHFERWLRDMLAEQLLR